MVLSKLITPKRFSSLSSSSSSHHFQHRALPLQTLLKSGFTPTLKDFNQFILFLSQNRKHKSIIHFFSQMTSNQIKGDSYTHSIFTWALLRERKYEEAEQFMNTHLGKTPIFRENRIWDSLIQGLCLNQKDPDKALSVLQHCLRIDGILPSSFTFRSLIHSFSSRGDMGRAIEVLEIMTDEKIKYPFDNFVSSSVISGFCKIGKPELAIAFYENAEKSGALKLNVVTYTTLVSAYCRLGRTEEVYDLVSKIEKKGLAFDVVFYSSWIYECVKEGHLGEALYRHKEMVEKKIDPDTISFSILIDGFSKEENVERATGFLNKMKKDGLKPNLVTYTAIMLGFCKKGKLEEAFSVFKMVEDLGFEVDEFMFATLIDGVCRRGDFDRVFSLLDEMEKKGINPSIVTYNIVINGLCKAGRTEEANEISKGVLGDSVTYSTLLHAYTEEENVIGALEIKRRLKEARVCMDVIMCNILIKAMFMVGSFEDALTIYKGMPGMDLAPDSVTYCTMIDGYCRVGRIDEALEIFDEFRASSVSSGACYNCIIHGLCKKGMVGMAIEVYMELNERGLDSDTGVHKTLIKEIFEEKKVEGVLRFVHRMENLGSEAFDSICNDAIQFLLKRGSLEAACGLYILMRKKGLALTRKSYYLILEALGGEKEWLTCPFLNTLVKKYGIFEPKVSKILGYYMCMKDVKIALRFLNKMKEKMSNFTFPIDVVKKLTNNGRVLDAYKLVIEAEDNLILMDVFDYTNLVDRLCKGSHIGKALNLCTFVEKKGIKLNIVTYNSVINGLCCQGCFIEAFRLFDSLEKINVLPSEITYSTLIDTLSKQGYLIDAKKLFEQMLLKDVKPNTRTFNSLIYGYCKFGQINEASKLLHDLEAMQLKSDGFTVSALISGCCHKGDMEGALGFFFEFKRNDLLPDFLGFVYLIRGLCSKGRMEECRSVLREMLQTQSVLDLLNRAGNEAESESIAGFLVTLCDQGSIREAITVLNEVGSMFFPEGRNSIVSTVPQEQNENYDTEAHMVGSNSLISALDFESCRVVKTYDDMEKTSVLHDFDSYYGLIASLCSRGELGKASKVVKMVSGFNRVC